MSTIEKFAFLGAVTLASVLIAQELDKTVMPSDTALTVIEVVETEPSAPEPVIPPTILSLAPSPAGFLDRLTACKGLSPSLGSNVDRDLVVTDYKPFVLAEGTVRLATAPDGKIRRQRYRRDYGNMIVLDHGRGVFTRYAHLETFADPDEGERVIAGQYLGMMGNTAGYQIPRHLHYEVLTGKWGAQAGSFALTPVDVMSLPEAP